MAKKLVYYPFTKSSDLVVSDGWLVGFGDVVNALAGDDAITGANTAVPGNTNYIDVGFKIYGLGGQVNTGAGNDTITGSSIYESGLVNNGAINTGTGNDAITGSGHASNSYFGIGNNGTINTGIGNDTIGGIGAFGISNTGTIDTGTGNDTITGTAIVNDGLAPGIVAKINTGDGDDIITGSLRGIGNGHRDVIDTGNGRDAISGSSSGDDNGISNSGEITTGADNDTITGINSYLGTGLYNYVSSHDDYILAKIDTGSGADTIAGSGDSGNGIYNEGEIIAGPDKDIITGSSTGSGTGIYNGKTIYGSATINTGRGGDIIIGSSYSGNGIYNAGLLLTGADNDTITGSRSYGGSGIFNSGTIDTGAGKDTINALQGGFSGTGFTSLGDGADTLKGFGTGNFNGGSGLDKILLGQGSYSIYEGTISSMGVKMNVISIENIGGVNGGLFTLYEGMFNVDQFGVMTLA